MIKKYLPSVLFKFFLPSEKRRLNDGIYRAGKKATIKERSKGPSRTKILNYLLEFLDRKTTYLEIGVRNPQDNFDHILADQKYSVDPGVEFESNPVDFKLTSDEFFSELESGSVLSTDVKFDLIFIDGLHLAEQVDKDIENALNHLKDDGFIVLHDCNPPTEWHARENYYYVDTPAGGFWNGTTWKAFLKYRFNSGVFSCCIDTDWGVGVISKAHRIGESIEITNSFYEYRTLENDRERLMNLMGFDGFKRVLESSSKA